MARIVLPGAVSAVGSVSGGIAVVDICVSVGIIYEVIIVVDVDVVIAAAPSGVPAPTSSPCGSHRDANPE